MTQRHGFLGLNKGKKIQFEEKITEELFTSLIASLNHQFGIPIFIHSHYGLIWHKDDKYICCKLIEEIYGSDFLYIFLFDKVPLGKRLAYNDYCAIDEAIKQVFNEYGFKCNTPVNYNSFGFAYSVSDGNIEWLLQLKGKILACYFADVTVIDSKTQKITPRYWCKKIINSNNTSTIKNAMKQSFCENQKAAKQ